MTNSMTASTTVKTLPINDATLAWVEQRCPELSSWRSYAVRWLASSGKGLQAKLSNLRIFFEEYLLRLELPMEPDKFLQDGHVWPSFPDVIASLHLSDVRSVACNDHIADFLSWILKDFSEIDSSGHHVSMAEFRNPVDRIRKVTKRGIDAIVGPHSDKNLSWVIRSYPELAAWRLLAVEWMAGQTGPSKPRLLALQSFFRDLIIGENLSTVPEVFFDASTSVPDFYTTCLAKRAEAFAETSTPLVHAFCDWVLTHKLSIIGLDGERALPVNYQNPINSQVPKRPSNSSDTELTDDAVLTWVEKRCPELLNWRSYAVRWLASSSINAGSKLSSLRLFFEDYLLRLNLPMEPDGFLREGRVWPSFLDVISSLRVSERSRVLYNDHIADFLSWILIEDFSEIDPFGHRVPMAGFHNPVRRIQKVADRGIDDPSLRPHNDRSLRWVIRIYPELAAWRLLAVEWMAGQTGPSKPRLLALQSFFRELIIGKNLSTVPEVFFDSSTSVPDFYTTCLAKRTKVFARPWTSHIHAFCDWVLTHKLSIVGPDGKRALPASYRNPITSQVSKVPSKYFDTELKWVTQVRPELEQWRGYAAEWLNQEPRGLDTRLKALVAFFDRYLIGQNLPTAPSFLLLRKSLVPDFYETCCLTGKDGKKKELAHSIGNNNRVSDFLDWVLKKHFTCEDDDALTIVSPAFHNPIPYRSHSGGWVNRESVHSPLPFGFIEDMRLMLAQGPNFRDWTWAQGALGGEMGVSGGRDGPDWFAVDEKDIDKDDPDCVWRLRVYEAGHSELQMWSPVRWVALLLKLQIPLRMLQVRLLDSGEADTWRYADGKWSLNTHVLAEGTERRPLTQGVFRRVDHLKGVTAPAILYVNTNKTADQKKSGPAKGYEVPWPSTGPIHQNPFYWAERLRNWQEKYNPITRRTSWSELGSIHIPLKSEEQLATYPNACFLFRTRELPFGERHLPMSTTAMNKPWFELLAALQERLHKTGQHDSGGSPFVFVPPREESNNGNTPYFPLQSLRVSLITALALDGLVPFPILQKLAGHSRLLMTLYYTKLGPTFVGQQLEAAAARLEEKKKDSIKRFAADAKHEELMAKVAYNSASSLKNVIAEDPGARNPAGWMLLHHGICFVGGNTSEIEENKKIGGCHNGGPNVGTELQPKWAPVPGGSRNCIRCRWFGTQPQYLPNLVATFNNHAYHFDEARNSCITSEERLQEIRRTKFEVEASGAPFTQMHEFLEIERVYEGAMKKFSDLAENLVAAWRLVERCSALLKESLANGDQLVAVGALTDVSVAFEETESELLQLSGVCEGVEVYPDLDPGKAVFRRSQLLDLALCREGSSPIFMTMSEADQLACGNAFMRQLANQVAPTDVQLGVRKVVELMDAGERIGQMLGVDLAKLVPTSRSAIKVIPISPLKALDPDNTDDN